MELMDSFRYWLKKKLVSQLMIRNQRSCTLQKRQICVFPVTSSAQINLYLAYLKIFISATKTRKFSIHNYEIVN